MSDFSQMGYGTTAVSENLDWVFLVDWILLLFASISIIFHFNRYMGVIITFFLRLVIWNRYRVRIKIKSLKVSFLGGRLFFKDLTIITKNETISILQGTLTWRYWINTTLRTDYELEKEDQDKSKNEKLPTRFILDIYGLEIFIYNRVYAYENVMDFIKRSDFDSDTETKNTSINKNSSMSSDTYKVESSKSSEDDDEVPKELVEEPTSQGEIKLTSFLNALPMAVEIKKGLVVIGNKTTSSILVLSFATGDGVLDISKAENKLDLYKSVFKMNFIKPKVIMRPNLSFDDSEKVFKPLRKRDVKAMRHGKSEKLIKLYDRLKTLVNLNGNIKQDYENEAPWNGLRQYVVYDGASFEDIGYRITVNHDEYAKYSELLDAELLLMYYYYDIPGKVPLNPEPTIGEPELHAGGLAPEYGMYFSVSHAVVHYGPWANRERVGLQKMLCPSACRDQKPHEDLSVGDDRQYSKFKIKIDVADEITFRVPFREFSKNVKIESDNMDADDDTKPPFGWIEVRLQKNTLILIENSFIATDKGTDNTVRAEFVQPEVRSSTNHNIFFKADSYVLQADIGFPLAWNGLHHWKFHNRLDKAEIFLLREHITLLSDMVPDFTYGLPTPYDQFKPFIYSIEIDFINSYKLYLNINDNNIINNPLDFNDNVYLSLQGETLYSKVSIPLTNIVRKSTCVSYDIFTDYFDLVLDAPPWHTLNNFLKSKKVGRSAKFAIEGSYTYYSVVEPGAVETIVIDCSCEDTVLEIYGFVLRYMIKIKENYFGIHKIFKTLQEYTADLKSSDVESYSTGEGSFKKGMQKPKKVENELDLLFSFSLQNGCAILPSNVYNCDSCVPLYFDTLDADIRFTNYYMDLQFNIPEIRAKELSNIYSGTLIEDALTEKCLQLKDQLVMRKFCAHGHRMFGLPPVEPTYFCKWDFVIESIILDGSPNFTDMMLKGFKNLKFSFKDTENLLAIKPVFINDIMVLALDCPSISINLRNDDGSVISIGLSPVSLNLNDMANERYSKRININIPNVLLTVLDSNDDVLCLLQTSIYFTDFVQKKDFEEEFNLQQEHVVVHDGPFHRLPFLITKSRDAKYRKAYGSIKPSYSIPSVAPPLNAQSIDFVFEDLQFQQENLNFRWNSSSEDSDLSPDDPLSNDRSAFDLYRSYYTDTEFSPSNSPDPDYEYDNLVVNLAPVSGFINPTSIDIGLDFLSSFTNFSVEGLLDDLQVDIIQGLTKLLNEKSTVTNVRLVTSTINVKYGDFHGIDSISDLEDSSIPHPDYLELLIHNVSSAISLKTTKLFTEAQKLRDRVISVSEIYTALHVREVLISAFKYHPESHQTSNASLVSLRDLEFWNSKEKGEEFIGSVNIRTVEASFDGDNLEWLAEFINTTRENVTNFAPRLEEIFSRRRAAAVALLYSLSTAGEKYRIEHDPAVLTKPAYIMRSSDHHMRSSDSWKVIVRLRHIMQSLPPEWLLDTNELFRMHQWDRGSNLASLVLDIFSNWRSWEFTDLSECFLFREVFDLDGEDPHHIRAPNRVNFALESLNVRLTSLDMPDDYLYLDFLNCSLSVETESLSEYDTESELFEVKYVTAVFSVESVKDSFSPLSMRLKNFASAIAPAKDSEVASISRIGEPKVSRVSYEVSLLIRNTENKVMIDQVGIKSSGKGLSLSALVSIHEEADGEVPFNVIVGFESIACDLLFKESTAGSFSSHNQSIVFSNSGSLDTGLKNVNCSFSELSLKFDKGTDEYLLMIDVILNNELEILKDVLLNLSIDSSERNTTKTETMLGKCPLVVNLTVERITWDLDIISPVKYTGFVHGLSVNGHVLRDIVVTNINAQSVITNLLSKRHKKDSMLCFKTEVSKFQLFNIMLLADDYDLLKIYMRCDRTVMTIPQLLQTLVRFFEDKLDALLNFEKMKELVGTFQKSKKELIRESKRPKSPTPDPGSASHKKSLLIKFSSKNNYVGFFTTVEDTLYRFDIRNSALSLFNYSLNEKNNVIPVKPYGEMTLPISRFLIGNGLEERTIVGVNLAIKVMNPDSVDIKLQSLQVEVPYCRLFLTPDILTRLISMLKKIGEIFEKHGNTEPELKIIPSEEIIDTSSDYVLGFYSFHVLAYNICIGWIFDDPKSSTNGLIMGCERIFIVSEERVGKLTLVDAYLSLAQGSSPSTFFSKSGEYEASSRAFLPKMQFIYAMINRDGRRSLHATVSGEKLDARFEANGVNMIEELLESVKVYKQLLNERKIHSNSAPGTRTSNPESLSQYRTAFHSIECITSFAGAKVVVYNSDADTLDECSSFTLESPAVKIALEYIRILPAGKKHQLRMEITTSSSKNTIYATCVPVIGNLYKGIRKMMRSAGPPSEDGTAMREVTSNSHGSVFEELGLSIGIHIEPQEIALSCEPTAKVAATGSFRCLDVRVGTCDDAVPAVWVAWRLDGLQASLQHVYSRETSGSINIDKILMTAFYNYTDDKKLATSAYISEVQMLINVKQLQDLDLFRDIWLPKELYGNDDDSSFDVQRTIPRSTSGEVSLITGMPWIIEFLMVKVHCTVDMGKSLGVLNLNLDRLWAVSKKSLTFEQNLRLAIDKIALTSEGRLGGDLSIEDVKVLTAISWNANNVTYEHPLVVISVIILSIQAKSSLDFHTFFVCNIKQLALNMFNKKGSSLSAHDSLFATADVKSLELYFTALAASNFWDIYSTLMRIRNDIQISYKEVLKESSNKTSDDMLNKKKQLDEQLAEIINALTTNLNVNFGNLLVHVYPSSLMDSQVLVFKLGEADAKFYQNTGKQLENRLKLRMTDFMVSLSTFHNKVNHEDAFNSMSIEDFCKNSRQVKGGTIFIFPSMVIDMSIWQLLGSNVIEYKFRSSFGGKVDIRWNLGSVNFIRDMWTAHANALSSRLESYRSIKARDQLASISNDKSLFESLNLEDKLKDVEMGSTYVYVPLEPLVAEAPQLKELGDATPPLEWFGLHRAKFPNVTHQMIILALQKMVHEVETQYGRILK